MRHVREKDGFDLTSNGSLPEGTSRNEFMLRVWPASRCENYHKQTYRGRVPVALLLGFSEQLRAQCAEVDMHKVTI